MINPRTGFFWAFHILSGISSVLIDAYNQGNIDSSLFVAMSSDRSADYLSRAV
jgi:hypothetical protein